MKEKKKKFDWWGYIKNILISLLKQKAIKIVLGKIVGIAIIPGGIQAWLASFIVEQLFDRLLIPILKELEMEGKYQVDVIEGKKKVRLLNENRSDPNAVSDAFSQL